MEHQKFIVHSLFIFAILVGPTTAYANLVVSNHWGSLTVNSPTYNRTGSSGVFYYEAIQVVVSVSGLYSFRSNSGIDSYGYLYLNNFNPFRPMDNLLTYNDDSGDYQQFLINIGLVSSNTYVLVFTTYSPITTTMFAVIGLGPGRVNYVRLNNISISMPTTQSRSTTQTASSTITTSTLSRIVYKYLLK
jgi:hypothetical protein